ncbi:MAG: hypothetical protein ACKO45_11245, partial [Cyanobium sp.]
MIMPKEVTTRKNIHLSGQHRKKVHDEKHGVEVNNIAHLIISPFREKGVGRRCFALSANRGLEGNEHNQAG